MRVRFSLLICTLLQFAVGANASGNTPQSTCSVLHQNATASIYGLTNAEVEIITGYTEGEFRIMNALLRFGPSGKEFKRVLEKANYGKSKNMDTLAKVRSRIATMDSALGKLPKGSGVFRRILGVGFKAAAQFTEANFQPGSTFVDKTFISVTKDAKGLINKDREGFGYDPTHIFVIKTNSAVDISAFSTRPAEGESIIWGGRDGLQFRVISVKGEFVRDPADADHEIYQADWKQYYPTIEKWFSVKRNTAEKYMNEFRRPLLVVTLEEIEKI